MIDYKSLKVGESVTVEREGIALAAQRWAVRAGIKYSRRKGNDGCYIVTRLA